MYHQQIQALNTEEKGLEISKIWRWIVQNTTLMSFKQLCQTWTCMQNQFKKCPFWMSNNFRKYRKTKARNIWPLLNKFKDIEGLLRFVRTLLYLNGNGNIFFYFLIWKNFWNYLITYLPIIHILLSSWNIFTWSDEMSAILDTILISLTVVLVTSQQGLTI
jgi:hypothetical protein